MAEPLALDKAVTLHQLRIFKAVADHLSFSAADQDLSLSQPAVSYQVQELEAAVSLPRHIVHLRRRRLPSAVSGFAEFLRTGKWKPASSSD